jgi:hypothetical protein
MKSDQVITVAISITLAILGWFVGYLTTIRRDRLSKQRDLRTQYLLDAYRRLEGAGNRHDPGHDDARALESAIADIQLLGSPEQVRLARNFALEFADGGSASLDPLLESLRLDLRKELALPPLAEGITYLRIVQGPRSDSASSLMEKELKIEKQRQDSNLEQRIMSVAAEKTEN